MSKTYITTKVLFRYPPNSFLLSTNSNNNYSLVIMQLGTQYLKIFCPQKYLWPSIFAKNVTIIKWGEEGG